MEGFSLSARQRQRLQEELRTTDEASLCRRALAVLEVAEGTPVARVARRLGMSRRTIYYWIECYTDRREPASLADRERSGRPVLWTEDVQSLLRECLKRRPEDWGYQAVVWTVPLLRDWLTGRTGLSFSETTIRQHLHELNYVWKRPRYVLQPDPEREKKKADPPGNQPFCTPDRAVVRGRN